MGVRAWTTLIVRGMGTVVLAYGAVNTLVSILLAAIALASPWIDPDGALGLAYTGSFAWSVTQGLWGIAAVAIGLYFLFKAQWLIDRICREIIGKCDACGYAVGEARSCPECGTPTTARQAEPTQPRLADEPT